jgi:hypothetical protein
MSNTGTSTMRAFIAAPADQNIDILKDELTKRNIQSYTAYDMAPATISLASNIEHAIKEADLMIAVISAQAPPNVFFEIGIAHALKKPFLLLISPQYGHLPSDLVGTFYLRTDPENREAIGFALDQSLPKIEKRISRPQKRIQKGTLLGDNAEQFLSLIQEKGSQLKGRELEQLVADVLRKAGVEAVSESPQHHEGADIAVWSDALQPLAGNPLLIEVKSYIKSKRKLEEALHQVERYRVKSGARLALLVVNAALDSMPVVPSIGGVLAVTLIDLIERLRSKTFPDAIRELRNQSVHKGDK